MAEADNQELKKPPRRRILKGTGALALLAALGQVDSETSGIACPVGIDPDFFDLFIENGMKDFSSTANQLWADPASSSSLIILCLASYGETQSDTGTVKGNKTGLNVQFENPAEPLDTYSEGESEQFPNRASLRNISIQDPASPRNTVDLKMIAHHRDPETSLNVCVFYEESTHNLLFVCPGVDQLSDLFAVNDTVAGRPNPADSEIANLMEDVLQQIDKLPVEHVTIFGHSLGAGPATEILAHLLHDEQCSTRFSGIEPRVAFVEEWKAMEAAENIAARSKTTKGITSRTDWPSVKKLSGYITSVRRVPGTITAQPNNPVLGKSARAIVPDNLWQLIRSDELLTRQFGHEEIDIAEELFVKKDKLVKTTSVVLNHIQPTALFRMADLIWEANVKPGVDIAARAGEAATAVALGVAGARKWLDRCQKVQEEKEARDAERAGKKGFKRWLNRDSTRER